MVQKLLPKELKALFNDELLIIPAGLVTDRKVDISVECPRPAGDDFLFKISLRMITERGSLVKKVAGGSGGVPVPGFRSGFLSCNELLASGQISESDLNAIRADYEQRWKGKSEAEMYTSENSARMYIGLEEEGFLALSLCERQNPSTGDVVVGISGVGFHLPIFGVVGGSGTRSQVLDVKSIMARKTNHALF